MTISSTESQVEYAGDDTSTVFAIPFVFDTSADLKVIQTDSDGNPVVLASGFSVAGGGGSTGTLTLSTALPTNETLTILDDPERTQTIDYINNDSFPAETAESGFDKATRLVKRMHQVVNNSIRVADGDPQSGDGMLLGSVANRKGKYLFFNASTGAVEYATALATSTLSRSTVGDVLNPQTAAELANGVTPTQTYWKQYDVRRWGAPEDESSDARAAFVLGNTAGKHILVDGGLTYVIATSLTLTVPVIIMPGAKISASPGATVTFSAGVICLADDWTQKFTGDGSVVIGIAQEVKCDWFGPVSTTLASPNGTVQKAITATARGSTIYFRGRYVSTPIDIIFDEGNQATATNRDAGKSLIGVSRGLAFRLGTQSVALGAEIILGDGEDDDLVTFTGVRFSSQPSRANIFIDGVTFNGNKAGNSSGRGVYFVSAKDIYGNLSVKDAAGDGIVWSSSASESSNVCNFHRIFSVNNGGDGINSGGLGDSQWGRIHTGGNGGDGAILGSGVTVSSVRSYVNVDHGVVVNGSAQIGQIRVNDCDEANVLIASAVEGASIASIHSSESALTPTSDGLDAHVVFSGAAISCTVGRMFCDDSGTPSKRWVYVNAATSKIEISSLSGKGTPSGQKVHIVSGGADNNIKIVSGYAAQTIAYAASVTPDPYAGKLMDFAELTGNIALTDFATLLVPDGYEVTTYFDADGTNRDITWNARWNHTDGATTTVTANTERVMKWVAKGNVFQLASDTTV